MRHPHKARSKLTPRGWVTVALLVFWGVVASVCSYFADQYATRHHVQGAR